MNTFDKVYTEIRNAYSEHRLIPFIGAGFSKPLELPDWDELVSKLAITIGYEPDLFLLHGSHQQLFEYCQINNSRDWDEFIYQMKLQFDSPIADSKRRKSITHQALSELDFGRIYTTNYDHHIEAALTDKGKKTNLIASLSDFATPLKAKVDCEIIKFHGTLAQEDTIVLTETEYFNRMELEEAVDQRLRSDLLSNSFLFIGYSFRDPNIRYIWYKIHKLKEQQTRKRPIELKKSYYVTFGDEPIQSALLKNWDIEIVPLSPENINESLSRFLKGLK